MRTLFLLSCLALVSCRQAQNKTESPADSQDTHTLLVSEKNKIDSLLALNVYTPECYFTDSGITQQGDCNRQDYAELWKLWKNNTGLVSAALHEYSSESNDIFVQEHYYFNSSGNLFSINRQVSFLNPVCSEKAIIHSMDYYYNNNAVIDSSETLTDSENHALAKDSCLIPYSIESEIPVTVEILFTSLHIK